MSVINKHFCEFPFGDAVSEKKKRGGRRGVCTMKDSARVSGIAFWQHSLKLGAVTGFYTMLAI